MNRRDAPWNDIDKTWKSLADLKKEIHRTEQKLLSAGKDSFLWSYANITTKSEVKRPASIVQPKRHVKRKIFSKLRGNNEDLKSNGLFKEANVAVKKIGEQSYHSHLEDQPNQPVQGILKANSQDINQKIISSVINKHVLQLSSDEASQSSTVSSYKWFGIENQSEVEPYFSFQNSATQTSENILNSVPGKSGFSNTYPKVQFSDWEKDYLHNELSDFVPSTTETDPVALRETEVYCLNNVAVQNEPKIKPQPIFPILGRQKIKEIVDKQRKRHEQNLFDVPEDNVMDGNTFHTSSSAEAVVSQLYVDKGIVTEDTLKFSKEPKLVPKKVDVEIQVKPPIVRKMTVAPPAAEYKGFSSCVHKMHKPMTQADRPHPETARPLKQQGTSKPKVSLPKRFKKIQHPDVKEVISPYCWREGQKLILKELGPPPIPSSSKQDHGDILDSVVNDDNMTSVISDDFQSSPEHLKHQEKSAISKTQSEDIVKKPVVLSKCIDIEREKENSYDLIKSETVEESHKGVQGAQDCEENSSASLSPSTSKHSELKILANNKRSAAIHTEKMEFKGTVPKIRHYDSEKVREYIQKQKAFRRAKRLEEKQKISERQREKNLRLQKLYDYQKAAAKTITKIKLISPVHIKENDNIPSKRASKSSINFSILDSDIISSSPKEISASVIEDHTPENLIPTQLDNVTETVPNVNNNITTVNVKYDKDGPLAGCSMALSTGVSQDGAEAPKIKSEQEQEQMQNINANSKRAKNLQSMALSIQLQIEESTKQLQDFLETKKLQKVRSHIAEVENSHNESDLEEGPLNESRITDKQKNEPEKLESKQESPIGAKNLKELFAKLMEPECIIFPQSPHDLWQARQERVKSEISSHESTESESSLSEGPIDSEEEIDILKENNRHIELYSHASGDNRGVPLVDVVKMNPSQDLFTFINISRPNPLVVVASYVGTDNKKHKPDPFNFINTWLRKPMMIQDVAEETVCPQQIYPEEGENGITTPISACGDGLMNSKIDTSSYTPDFTASDEGTSVRSSPEHDDASEVSAPQASVLSTITSEKVFSSTDTSGTLHSLNQRSKYSQNLEISHINENIFSALSLGSKKEVQGHTSEESIDEISRVSSIDKLNSITEENIMKDRKGSGSSVISSLENKAIPVSSNGVADIVCSEDSYRSLHYEVENSDEVASTQTDDKVLILSNNETNSVEKDVRASDISNSVFHKSVPLKEGNNIVLIPVANIRNGTSSSLSNISEPSFRESVNLITHSSEIEEVHSRLKIHKDIKDYNLENVPSLENLSKLEKRNSESQEQQSVPLLLKQPNNSSSVAFPRIFTSTILSPNEFKQSPSSLGLRLSSDLMQLETLQDSLLQVSELNRFRGLALARREKASVSQEFQEEKVDNLSSRDILHSHVITRVATEAAAAAATSAVIAVLETQKSLHAKELRVSDSIPKSNSSSKHESYQYSSDFESSQKSQGAPSSLSKSSNAVTEVLESYAAVPLGLQSSIPEDIPIALDKEGTNNEVSSDISVAKETSIIEENAIQSSVANSKTSKYDEASVIENKSSIGRLKQSQLTISGGKKKQYENISSPSPASLSDIDTLSSGVISSSDTTFDSADNQRDELHSMLSEDSLTRFTLEMVRRMTHEEELRARHQLSLLRFQEKALVEKARAEMTWLELLKKKLQKKGSDNKILTVTKRQQELASRLRQERAQLRCMQETYRSVSKKRQSLLMEKRKLLRERNLLIPDSSMSKTKRFSSHSSQEKHSEPTSVIKSRVRLSPSSSSIVSEEDGSVTEVVSTPEIPENSSRISDLSSRESVESSPQMKMPIDSSIKASKSLELSTSRYVKPEFIGSRISPHSNNSLEFILQGLKRLEASKRYLTKKEQKLLQRRKEVENLLQWQKKLDNEELAILEMEKKALEIIDESKHRHNYYISSSTLCTAEGSNISEFKPNERSSSLPTLKDSNSVVEIATIPAVNSNSSHQSKVSDSVREECLQTNKSSGESVEQEEECPSYEHTVTSFVKESSIKEQNSDSSSTMKEEISGSPLETLDNVPEDVTQSQSENGNSITDEVHSYKTCKLSTDSKEKNSFVSADAYSEKFESSCGSDLLNMSNSSVQSRSSSVIDGGNKASRSLVIRSPLIPHNHRRHDSSGSDDSYTISHSETASDQSDIEGRIHALSEELKRRKTEAEKLKREQKKRYREQLKERELSLQKQVEAYDQYIRQAQLDLEQQLEATISSTPQSLEHTPMGVKPQIKKPRVAESRRLRKQAHLEVEQQSESVVASPPQSLEHIAVTIKPQIKKPCVAESRRLRKEPTTGSEVLKKVIVEHSTRENSGVMENITELENEERKFQSSLWAKAKMLSITLVKETAKGNMLDPESSFCAPSSGISSPVDSISNSLRSKTVISEDVDKWEGKIKTSTEEKLVTEDNSVEDIVEELDSDKSGNTNGTSHNESRGSDSSLEFQLAPSDDTFVIELGENGGGAKNAESVSAAECTETRSFENEKCAGLNCCSIPVVAIASELNEAFVTENLNRTFAAENINVIVVNPNETFIVSESDKKCDNEDFIGNVGISFHTQHDNQISTKVLKHSIELSKKELTASNIIDELVSSMCADTIVTTLKNIQSFNGAGKVTSTFSPTAQLASAAHINKESDFQKNISLRSIHESAAQRVSEMLTELLLNDAIDAILNIFKNQSTLGASTSSMSPSEKAMDILTNLDNSKKSSDKCRPQELMVLSSSLDDDLTWLDNVSRKDLMLVQHQKQNISEGPILKNVKEKDSETDFFCDQEWFEDDFYLANGKSQPLEPLGAYQGYPFYYRQIPNKPPPPYTPPSDSSAVCASSVIPLKIKKPAEAVSFVPRTLETVGQSVTSTVMCLLSGVHKGLPIADIVPTTEKSEFPEEDIVLQCQKIYSHFLFDLAKEVTSEMYRFSFHERHPKPEPWIRPRRLTKKPMFPPDEQQMICTIQSEVCSLLKLNFTPPAMVIGQKCRLWSAMKLGCKKRDFVDTILINELKDEESGWVNYDKDELTVKLQLTDSIFDLLIDDTAKMLRDLQNNISASSVQLKS